MWRVGITVETKLVRRYVTPASTQFRVQHRKSSPMDRMNPGRVRLGRTGRNGRKVNKGLVAA